MKMVKSLITRLRHLFVTPYLLLAVLHSFFLTGSVSLLAEENVWEKIDEGLYVGRFVPEQKSVIGNYLITIIRIDPQRYSLRLLSASELGVENMSVRQWAREYNLIGAVNAGMFLTDHKTNVAYMKNFEHFNNGKIHNRYKSVAAFNPVDNGEAEFKIFDIDEEDMSRIIENYNTVIQNLRLIKRPGRNVWSQQERIWSEAALGEDEDGNILIIFCRSPYSMFDFNNILLSLPINLVAAQHLEGGAEASLYFNYRDTEIQEVGSYETGFMEHDNNWSYWRLPNVIGFEKRAEE